MIEHFPSCTGNYPEKPEGDSPRHIEELDIGDGKVVRQCSDCGAFEIKTGEAETNGTSQTEGH